MIRSLPFQKAKRGKRDRYRDTSFVVVVYSFVVYTKKMDGYTKRSAATP